ncbi:hypothetical protein [uncultured Zoogloea sp.]|uniref:hypothetical protein n=1 Tax=uncultured Zoogloea sp. TaxID=160237 RepID=UPI0026128270|nr:hypothetical protein [uncultured Zoogloea sp.]
MTNVTTLIPDDALLFDVAQQACAAHLHLISNGERFALSPTIPAGWHAVPVADKSNQIRRAA